jgi:hypothetical protein
MRRLPAIVAALVIGVTSLAACGGGDPAVERAEARSIESLDTPGVPGVLHDLKVKREDLDDVLDDAKRPYLDGMALFSLRDGDRLMATLQIGHFAPDAKWKTSRFRSSLLATIGGGNPRRLRMDDQSVYLTSGDRQALAVWFEDQHLFILSTREDYDFPRGLLRDATELVVGQ